MSKIPEKSHYKIRYNELVGLPKESIKDYNLGIKSYDNFINSEMVNKYFNTIERDNLVEFIEKSMQVITDNEPKLKVMECDPNIEFQAIAPKLITKPITHAQLDYHFIVKRPTETSKGIYGYFMGFMDRANEDSPWNSGYIPIKDMSTKIFVRFEKEQYEKMGLMFKSKKTVNDSVFYTFTTSRNSIPLILVFEVWKSNYNEQEIYPANWNVVQFKRG